MSINGAVVDFATGEPLPLTSSESIVYSNTLVAALIQSGRHLIALDIVAGSPGTPSKSQWRTQPCTSQPIA